jgi:hypothetical protein
VVSMGIRRFFGKGDIQNPRGDRGEKDLEKM